MKQIEHSDYRCGESYEGGTWKSVQGNHGSTDALCPELCCVEGQTASCWGHG